jgi:enhancing lycopene biosynthesis protein 2
VVHRGVDVDLFNPDNVNQTRIVNFVEGLAIPEDVPVIMLPARATDVERAPDFIAGFGQDQRPTFHLFDDWCW